MITWYELLVLGLATQRLTAIWLSPLGIVAPVREYLARSASLLKVGVNCGLCTSTWFATGLYFVWQVEIVGPVIVVVLAIGSVTSIVNMYTKGS